MGSSSQSVSHYEKINDHNQKPNIEPYGYFHIVSVCTYWVYLSSMTLWSELSTSEQHKGCGLPSESD